MRDEQDLKKSESPSGVHVWLVLMKAYQAIERAAAADLQACELGESDFRVLEVLLHKGPLPVNTIGPKVNLTPGSISTAVNRLHSRSFVSRVEDKSDRRIRIVDLTVEGRALIEQVFENHAALLEEVAGVLSHSEREHLEKLLKKIGRSAETFVKSTGPTNHL